MTTPGPQRPHSPEIEWLRATVATYDDYGGHRPAEVLVDAARDVLRVYDESVAKYEAAIKVDALDRLVEDQNAVPAADEMPTRPGPFGPVFTCCGVTVKRGHGLYCDHYTGEDQS